VVVWVDELCGVILVSPPNPFRPGCRPPLPAPASFDSSPLDRETSSRATSCFACVLQRSMRSAKLVNSPHGLQGVIAILSGFEGPEEGTVLGPRPSGRGRRRELRERHPAKVACRPGPRHRVNCIDDQAGGWARLCSMWLRDGSSLEGGRRAVGHLALVSYDDSVVFFSQRMIDEIGNGCRAPEVISRAGLVGTAPGPPARGRRGPGFWGLAVASVSF